MATSGNFYDELEIRDPEAREAALMAALSEQVAHAMAKAPAFGRILAGVDPAQVCNREALAILPVTRKSDLIKLQRGEPPLGGLAALAPGAAARLFMSPGPVYEPQSARDDHWRTARALFAAGFRAGDVVHNAFSYHLTPGGWILDGGARALGCTVVPAGAGNSDQQAQAIAHVRPSGFAGTPDFLKVLLDKGAELGLDCGSIKKALVSGGALFATLRQYYAERGITVLQCYATAELGLIAYETLLPDGKPCEGMIVDEQVIVEIVLPGTGDPLPQGEVGEVVVTTLNPDYPLVRFATGDLSAVLSGRSPCGRTNLRLMGWMGRADQSVKVKGMFVQPSQIAQIKDRHPEVSKVRLVVERMDDTDVMTLICEVDDGGDSGLATAIANSLQGVCKLKGEVAFTLPKTLPNDGKVIEDKRQFD